MNYEKEYNEVCFNLKKAEEELEAVKFDIFTHNPKINELIDLIADLNTKKHDLKNKMENNK